MCVCVVHTCVCVCASVRASLLAILFVSMYTVLFISVALLD